MAHVTDSFDTTTLPGTIRKVPQGQKCDDCENIATIRVQGETDSFGAEWYDFCETCYVKHRELRKQHKSGKCDWCKRSRNFDSRSRL